MSNYLPLISLESLECFRSISVSCISPDLFFYECLNGRSARSVARQHKYVGEATDRRVRRSGPCTASTHAIPNIVPLNVMHCLYTCDPQYRATECDAGAEGRREGEDGKKARKNLWTLVPTYLLKDPPHPQF